MRYFSMICIAVFALSAAGDGHAKSLARMLGSSGLAPGDIEAMGDAARSLYDRSDARAGSQAKWTNAETGAHGVVRLEKLSGGCADLLHNVFRKGEAEAMPLRTRQCKTADGGWQLTP